MATTLKIAGPGAGRRRCPLLTSLALHIAAAALLWQFDGAMRKASVPDRRPGRVALVAPPAAPKPQVVRRAAIPPPPRLSAPRLEAPVITTAPPVIPPRIQPAAAPVIQTPVQAAVPLPSPPPAPPPPAVKSPPVVTGMFHPAAAPAPSAPREPVNRVQTGAFAGSAAVSARTSAAGEVRTGAFEATASTTGQRRGRGSAEYAASGFESPAGPARPSSRTAAVRDGGFSAVSAQAAPAAARNARAQAAARPVEILSKPKPAYTEEARRLKIEGEVVLEVLFSAAGQAQVRRVVEGLGHGLDENAVRAAEAIRFRPAAENGSPVDSVSLVRIVFQIAY